MQIYNKNKSTDPKLGTIKYNVLCKQLLVFAKQCNVCGKNIVILWNNRLENNGKNAIAVYDDMLLQVLQGLLAVCFLWEWRSLLVICDYHTKKLTKASSIFKHTPLLLRTFSPDCSVSELCRQSLDLMAWYLLRYRQVCAFPNHVQSIEFTTGGLQSRCIHIS